MSITPALPTSSFDRCVRRTAPAALPAQAADTEPRYSVGGDWNLREDGAWGETSPVYGAHGTFLTNPDGDGTFTLTLDTIPSGPRTASVAVLGETVTVSDEVAFTTTEGFDVEFAYTPATGALTVTPERAGAYDPSDDTVFWVDEDTLAFPADLTLNPEGTPRPAGQDHFELMWDPTGLPTWGQKVPMDAHAPVLGWDETTYHGTDLVPSRFTPEQLAAHPELAGHIALDLPAGSWTAADLDGTVVAVARDVDSSPAWVSTGANTWYAYTGVADSTASPFYAPFTAPGEPVVEGRGVELERLGAIALRVPEGAAEDTGLVGDWDGDGTDEYGVVR